MCCSHLWKWERELCQREAGRGESFDYVKKGVPMVTTDIMRCKHCGEAKIDGPIPEGSEQEFQYLLLQ